MKLQWFEKGEGFQAGIRDLPKTFTIPVIGNALIAAVFGWSVTAIFITTALEAGWPHDMMVGWIFGLHVLGGFLCWFLSLYYKKPFTGAPSIPGGVLFATAAATHGVNAVIGAAMFGGLIIFLLGISGAIKKVMSYVPLPIVLGMTAGVLVNFVIAIPTAIVEAPLIAGLAVIGYLVCSRWVPGYVPGAIGALIFGAVAFAVFDVPDFTGVEFAFAGPMFFMPEFNILAMLSVGIPLAILVIGAENAQSYGVLQALSYKPDLNGMTIYSGIAGTFAPLFGSHTCNIAGPMTVITSAPEVGPKEIRYGSAVLNGLFYGIAGPFALMLVGFFEAIPGPLVSVVAGLAMIKVVGTALAEAIQKDRFLLSGSFAFIFGASGIELLGVTAPLWALIGGLLVAIIIEYNDYMAFINEE